MPYRGCPDTVRRAVDAVLAQTHTDLVLVVVADGSDQNPWPYLADITDDRLVRLDLPEQRGRYFADAVTLAACSTPLWTVHDADDVADPEWLERMLAALEPVDADVVLTAQRVHHLNGRAATERVTPWGDGAYRHHAHMAGLWSTAWLRAIGGPHPGYQIGWDTMLTGAALAAGRAVILDEVLYARHKRRGSLTTSPATGQRSALRRATVGRLRALWPDMVAAAPDTAAIGQVLGADVDAADRAAIAEHAGRLADLLGAAPYTPPERPARTALETPELWTGWALDAEGAHTLDAMLRDTRPGTVVECGSGSSTVLLAEYAAATGARIVSLEHDPRWHARTLHLLTERGLAGHVDVRLAPLRHTPAGPWYNTGLPGGVDLVLVDGPPERAGGRAAALDALRPHLAADAVLLLDDADRPGEAAALERWQAAGARVSLRLPMAEDGKTMAIVQPRAIEVPAVDARDVVVTVLTGGRPDLLASTLEAVRATAPGLLETAYVHLLDNGPDARTSAVLGAHADVLDAIERQVEQPIGEAVTHLAEAAAASGRTYWLHLEDDWAATPDHAGWLDTARRILAEHPQVHQVRLRHDTEQVLGRHMHTRRPLRWDDRGDWRYAPEAHWTLNPTLVRTAGIHRVWPAVGERQAQAHAHDAGMRGVAQLVPGTFVHTGGDASRRAVTGCTP
jgi:predicted O-methyltransferase YrrM